MRVGDIVQVGCKNIFRVAAVKSDSRTIWVLLDRNPENPVVSKWKSGLKDDECWIDSRYLKKVNITLEAEEEMWRMWGDR